MTRKKICDQLSIAPKENKKLYSTAPQHASTKLLDEQREIWRRHCITSIPWRTQFFHTDSNALLMQVHSSRSSFTTINVGVCFQRFHYILQFVVSLNAENSEAHVYK